MHNQDIQTMVVLYTIKGLVVCMVIQLTLGEKTLYNTIIRHTLCFKACGKGHKLKQHHNSQRLSLVLFIQLLLSIIQSSLMSVSPSVCPSVCPSICPSVCPSICPSICLSLKISVTTKLIGLYSSENIPTGPVVVLRYFLGGWDTPKPPKKQKNSPEFF